MFSLEYMPLFGVSDVSFDTREAEPLQARSHFEFDSCGAPFWADAPAHAAFNHCTRDVLDRSSHL
jgi:hypothetical protein